MEERRKFAFRPGTLANHRTHFANFVRFCIFFNLQDLPVSGNTLSLHSEFLFRTYSSPSSILNAISSIKFYHLLLNFDTAGFQDFHFSLTKRALPRSVRTVTNPALPVTLDLLRAICAEAVKLGTHGVAFKALCLISFYTLARLSSLVPASAARCDITRTLMLSDIQSTVFGFNVTIKWSKSQQLLQQRLVLPLIRRDSDVDICPVLAVSALLLQLLPSSLPDSPLFAWPVRNGASISRKFFTISSARNSLKVILNNLGLSRDKFSFHSFRRGGCQLGYANGATVQDLKFLGGWASDAIRTYLPVDQATFRAASSLVK